MSLRPLRTRLLLPLAAVALLATACASSADDAALPTADEPVTSAAPTATPTAAPSSPASTEPEPSSTPPVPTVTITIVDFEYDIPGPVAGGAVVQVVNEDAEAHTVTLGSGGPSVVVQGGQTTKLTAPAEAGTYPVSCDFHGGMTAQLVVT